MATATDLNELPTAQHITVLCKMHKSTVLLSVLPDDSLVKVKQQLLAALQSRNISTLPGTDTPLPKATSLELGVLVDRKDRTKGWTSAENRASLPKKRKTKTDEGKVETMAELELKDGMYIAYRLKSQTEIEMDDDGDMHVDELGWDVQFPSYDDEEEEAGGDDDIFGDDIEIPKPRNVVSNK